MMSEREKEQEKQETTKQKDFEVEEIDNQSLEEVSGGGGAVEPVADANGFMCNC